MELLGYFANQAAVALELLLAARRAQSALGDVDDRLGLVAQIASDLEALPPERQEAGMRLLRALGELLQP
jgi:hypothetical protein